jgi:hypothetical protein
LFCSSKIEEEVVVVVGCSCLGVLLEEDLVEDRLRPVNGRRPIFAYPPVMEEGGDALIVLVDVVSRNFQKTSRKTASVAKATPNKKKGAAKSAPPVNVEKT